MLGEATGELATRVLSEACTAAREVMAICLSNRCNASWMDDGALLGRWDARAATVAAWEVVSKSATMFIGERMWNTVAWGKRERSDAERSARRAAEAGDYRGHPCRGVHGRTG